MREQVRPQKTNIKILRGMICFVVFTLGICVWIFLLRNSPTFSVAKIPVMTMRLEKEFIDLYEELPGRIVPYQVAEIRPQVTGIITERLFEEGSNVKSGQQLYQIDPAAYQAVCNSDRANLMRAEAGLKTIKSKANRYEKLIKVGAVSRQDYDDVVAQLAEAEADVGIAQAALEASKINLAYTKVYAPISGRIGKSDITKGALVTANQLDPIARITQLDPIYVDMTQQHINQNIRLESSNEKSVALFFENRDAPYSHQGKLQFKDVTVDPTTNSVLLRAIFPNVDQILLPGLFVRGKIKVDTVCAMRIPQKAVICNPDGSMSVWIVNQDNKVTQQIVAVERALNDHWIVQKGLSDGDVIVLEGFQKLTSDATVDPTESEKANKQSSVREDK